MRKFTLFFASVLACVSAMAQTVVTVYSVTETKLTSAELNAKTESTMIAIKNLSKTNHDWFIGTSPYDKANFNANGEAVFVWEPVTEGQAGSYYLKKLDGTYMQTTSPGDFGAKESAAVFTTTNPTSKGSGSTLFNGDSDSQSYINGNDDANLVRFVNAAGQWINVQGTGNTPKYNDGKGGWTIHYAYTVNEEEITQVQITYNFMLGEKVVATQTETVTEGEAYPDYEPALPYGTVAAAKPEGTVTTDGTYTIALTVEKEVPFKAYEDAASIETWYYVQMHALQNYRYYISAGAEDKLTWYDAEGAPAKKVAANAEDIDNYLWGFVGNLQDGYKVVNKAGKAMASTGTSPVTVGEFDAATTLLAWTPQTTEDGWFCLKNPKANTYLNLDVNKAGVIGHWSANDNGSSLLVTEYHEPADLTVIGATVGDVVIVDNKATVESVKTIDVYFDRPVALAEGAGWATIADKYGPVNLAAEVLEAEEGSSEYVVRFSVTDEIEGAEFTAAGEYELNIPAGFIVGAEENYYFSPAIAATITIEGGAATTTPLTVVNVTVDGDVVDPAAIVATKGAMIKVNFDAKSYFQGEPVIVDNNIANPEENDALASFDFVNGIDSDGSQSYILMGYSEGTYTITLPKASFNEMEMMQWKAPAEDIVLTVTITANDATAIESVTTETETVIYDLLGRRVEKMEKGGIYIVNGRKVIK